MKKQISLVTTLIAVLAVLGTQSTQADPISWDAGGGDDLWTTAANWSGDILPTSADDVTINGASVIYDVTDASGTLPAASLTLTGATTLTLNTVLRGGGATIDVGPSATLSSAGGGLQFYDFNNSSVTFDSGAQITGVGTSTVWENKGMNTFTFNLDAGGFTTLTPNILNVSGANYATTTYNVDLQNYTGGAGSIVLVDFGSEFSSTTDALFQQGTINIVNAGAYAASTLSFNETDKSFVLAVIPEPSSLALLVAGGLGLLAAARRSKERV